MRPLRSIFVTALVMILAAGAASAQAQPPDSAREIAYYRVRYGLLGEIGELALSFSPEGKGNLVRATGSARGDLMGFAEGSRRLSTEFDRGTLTTRGWVSTRWSGDKIVMDIVKQNAGHVALTRRRTGRPDHGDQTKRPAPVMDPMALVVRLRQAPPRAPERHEVLDGRAMWAMSLQPAVVEGNFLKIAGRADPIYWDGGPDPQRQGRSFTLWLTNDASRLPTRLVMPYGLGEIEARLVSVGRPPEALRPLPFAFTAAELRRWITNALPTAGAPPRS